MELTHRLRPVWIFSLIILILTSCAPPQTQPEPAPVSQTATPSPTETMQWFPPSQTPAPPVVRNVTATPVYLIGIGETIFTDDFSSPSAWDTASADAGSVNVSRNRLTIAVKEPKTYLFSLRNVPLLSDFYAEINVHPTLCKGGDSYGLLFRAAKGAAYRYALACDGTVRLERLKAYNRPRTIQEALPSGDAPLGSPGDVRLGVWVFGSQMRFFLNGRYQFSAEDPNLKSGTLGVFAESAGQTAVTVTFSDLVVQSVDDLLIPTPTIAPTKTQKP